MTAIALPAVVGAAGLGVDISRWYLTQRDMQNAADAAVLAASTNGGSNYAVEAKGVAALYGFTDGVENVTVAASNAATCPTGGSNCYSVTITGSAPTLFAGVVGYAGNSSVTTTTNGVATTQYGTHISAVAVASQGTQPRAYCILALASSGSTGFRTNGAPKSDLSGCNIMSNTGATCNGHNTNANYGDAHNTNSGCGVVQRSNVTTVADPYSGLASNIPTDTCAGNYPQVPTKKKDPALPASNQWAASASKNLSGNITVCGDLQLTGNVTVNAPNGAVLVIQNGRLDTNGFTLKTSSGSGLTVVFSGSNAGGYVHAPSGGGVLDIAAPTTGAWKGVALYQDPKLTSGVDVSEAGNSPTWDMTGLIYMPHASVTFSGIINKATNGKNCFAMVVDNILVNGTAQFLQQQSECAAAGLTPPTGSGPGGRGQLVL